MTCNEVRMYHLLDLLEVSVEETTRSGPPRIQKRESVMVENFQLTCHTITYQRSTKRALDELDHVVGGSSMIIQHLHQIRALGDGFLPSDF